MLDFKDQKTLAYAVIGCTAVAFLILIIDLKIAKDLVRRAQELDGKVTAHEQARDARIADWPSVPRNHSGVSVVGDPGMAPSVDSEGDSEEVSAWDEFPVSRAAQINGSGGSRNLALPEKDR